MYSFFETFFFEFPNKISVFLILRTNNFNSFGSNVNRGSCIYSKIPIINKGKINFDDSNHGGIYIDVKRGRDTLKIINVHYESIGLSRKDSLFANKNLFSLKCKKYFFRM